MLRVVISKEEVRYFLIEYAMHKLGLPFRKNGYDGEIEMVLDPEIDSFEFRVAFNTEGGSLIN